MVIIDFFDGSKPDRYIDVRKNIKGITPFENKSTYTYLDCIYIHENLPEHDDDNNVIEGTYDVYSPVMYLSEEYYNMFMDNKIKEYIKVTSDMPTYNPTINKVMSIRRQCSYIFYKPHELQQIIDALK
jgi:hypothetical protein